LGKVGAFALEIESNVSRRNIKLRKWFGSKQRARRRNSKRPRDGPIPLAHHVLEES